MKKRVNSMRKQTASLCLSVVISSCCVLSFVSNASAGESTVTTEHRGTDKQTDENAYIDKNGAKGWYTGSDGKATTPEGFEQDAREQLAAMQQRHTDMVNAIEDENGKGGVSKETISDLREQGNQMKESNNKQLAQIHADVAGAKPVTPTFQKALVSKERK